MFYEGSMGGYIVKAHIKVIKRKTIKHDKIKKVLETYNKSLLVNKQKIVRENINKNSTL